MHLLVEEVVGYHGDHPADSTEAYENGENVEQKEVPSLLDDVLVTVDDPKDGQTYVHDGGHSDAEPCDPQLDLGRHHIHISI